MRERHIFPPILFSIFWLATSSPVTSTYFTSTNVLLAIQPTASGPQDLNIWTIILLAVGWIGLVCFITYSSRPITMILNVAFALYKVVLLLVLLVAGMKAGGANRNNSSGGWNELVPQGSITTTASSLSALMLVIYSYSGFQNANYVSEKSRLVYLRLSAHSA